MKDIHLSDRQRALILFAVLAEIQSLERRIVLYIELMMDEEGGASWHDDYRNALADVAELNDVLETLHFPCAP